MAYQTHNLPYTPTITCNCRDNVSHGPVCYKIEWIYTKTKMSGPDSIELALIMNKKERKKERLRNGHFFEHLVLACTIDLMNDLGLIR